MRLHLRGVRHGLNTCPAGGDVQLTDAQLGFYVDDVLAFKREHKQGYQSQIDYLIQTLTSAINANTGLGVTKIIQAGSWAKGTALRPRDGIDLDIDLIVYLDATEADRTEVAKLHSKIVELLKKTYAQKSAEDFKPSKKTVGIEFRTSGLKVDLVPAIPIKDPAEFVWQPEVGGLGSYRTSPPGQLAFVREIKQRDSRFATIVRLLKRWRHRAELEAPSSFVLELITGHVGRLHGTPPSIEEGLLQVLVYIAQSELRERIAFSGAIGAFPKAEQLVRIHDPTNNENNAAARITDAERVEIVAAAARAAEAINRARWRREKGDTLDAWKGVMGTPFRVEEDA